MSYGSARGVAALSSLYTNNGEFTDDGVCLETIASEPSLTEVETWLDEVSAAVDVALSNEGFQTPVTVSQVVKMLDGYVNGIVKDLVDYSHGAGRYFTEKYLGNGITPQIAIDGQVMTYIRTKATAFAALGVRRISTVSGQSTAKINML